MRAVLLIAAAWVVTSLTLGALWVAACQMFQRDEDGEQ